MALQLRSKLTRCLNPNRNPKPKSLSTSAPDSGDAEISRQQPAAPSSVIYLKKFVGELLTFDDDGVEKVNTDGDGASVRKRMLAKMRYEWKAFKDGGGRRGEGVEFGEEEEGKMKNWSLELGEAEKKVWSEGDANFLELEGNGVRKWSGKEVEESRCWMDELGEVVADVENLKLTKNQILVMGKNDDGVQELPRLENEKEKKVWSEGDANFLELEGNGVRKWSDKEVEESKCWMDDLGEVVADVENLKVTKNQILVMGKNDDGVQELPRLENEKEKSKEKGGEKVARSNLDHTLQMLKTTKKKLLGGEAESKGVSVSRKSTSLDEERNKSVGLTELLGTLKKFENDLDKEKEQLRLYRDKVVKDCIHKLHMDMVKEEEHIRSKFNKALREIIQKLRQEVEDEERRIKTSFNGLLMESYSKMHEQFRKEKERLESSYNKASTDGS